MSDIFISYANQDRSRAKKFVAAFEDQGWSVFWDRTIPTGKTWREVIGKELEESKCVVVLWTKDSVVSAWVHEEADDGLRRKILVPVQIQNVQPPIGFGGIQTANLSRWKGGKASPALKVLLDDIRAIVEAPARGAAKTPKRKPARKASKKTPGGKTAADTRKKSKPATGKPKATATADTKRRGILEKLAMAALILMLVAGGFYIGRKQVDQTQPLQSAQDVRKLEEANERKRDDAAWETAKLKNTVAGYQEYRASHPKGRHFEQTGQKIDDLQNAAQREKEQEEARIRDEIEKRTQDETAWAQAKRINTVASYSTYLKGNSEGRHREQATLIIAALEPVEKRRREEDSKRRAEEDKRRRDDMAWEQARRQNTIASYLTYQQAFPDGRHHGDAVNRIASLSVKPAPAPPPPPTPPAQITLLDTITPSSDWAIASRKNCFKPGKFYSLRYNSPYIVWRDGLGNVDVELVVSSEKNEFRTTTHESKHITKKNVTIGQTWTYRKIGSSRILVSPGGKRDFHIEKCS